MGGGLKSAEKDLKGPSIQTGNSDISSPIKSGEKTQL